MIKNIIHMNTLSVIHDIPPNVDRYTPTGIPGSGEVRIAFKVNYSGQYSNPAVKAALCGWFIGNGISVKEPAIYTFSAFSADLGNDVDVFGFTVVVGKSAYDDLIRIYG